MYAAQSIKYNVYGVCMYKGSKLFGKSNIKVPTHSIRYQYLLSFSL